MNDHITPDYEFRWIEDDNILLITTFDISTQKKIEAYYDVMDEYIRNWSPEKPYLLLFDSTKSKTNNWTSYMRQRAEQAHSLISEQLTGRTASVLNANIITRIVKPFVEQGLNRKKPNITLRIFYKYDEALHWLKQALPH